MGELPRTVPRGRTACSTAMGRGRSRVRRQSPVVHERPPTLEQVGSGRRPPRRGSEPRGPALPRGPRADGRSVFGRPAPEAGAEAVRDGGDTVSLEHPQHPLVVLKLAAGGRKKRAGRCRATAPRRGPRWPGRTGARGGCASSSSARPGSSTRGPRCRSRTTRPRAPRRARGREHLQLGRQLRPSLSARAHRVARAWRTRHGTLRQRLRDRRAGRVVAPVALRDGPLQCAVRLNAPNRPWATGGSVRFAATPGARYGVRTGPVTNAAHRSISTRRWSNRSLRA